jgi:hypothetical protein
MIDDANDKLVERNAKIKDQHFEIEATNRKLKVVNESSIDNMAVLMHDFSSFSDTVKISVESLKASSSNLLPHQIDVLNAISTSNDKLNYIAQKLSGTTSTTDATVNFNKVYFDINPEVEKAVLDIAESAMLKNMNLQLNISPAANNIYQDKLFIDQVLSKLMNNVIKHSQSGSIITVKAEHIAGKAVVEVVSHGVAIGMDKLNEMFDKFRNATTVDENTFGIAGTFSKQNSHGYLNSSSGADTYGATAYILSRQSDVWIKGSIGFNSSEYNTTTSLPIFSLINQSKVKATNYYADVTFYSAQEYSGFRPLIGVVVTNSSISSKTESGSPLLSTLPENDRVFEARPYAGIRYDLNENIGLETRITQSKDFKTVGQVRASTKKEIFKNVYFELTAGFDKSSNYTATVGMAGLKINF